ncbi:uncharacterized protein [Mytilus edulis]|uniref:uncharacterized protein n=1 Tax=Mytilus edulis TaxID=6550 RepID=UPI0039EDECCC
MATERALNCGPCDYKHETNSAVKWCVDCTEALCSTCFGVHKSLKVLRNHNVIGIEDKDTLQGIILDLPETQICEKHDKTSEYFCPLHDDIVCIKCIQTSHIHCDGWLPISEAADGVKSSVAKETITQDLEDVIKNVEDLIESHEQERISNQNVWKNLKDEASEVVQRVVQRVKDIETEFINTIEVQQNNISSKIGSRTIKFKDKLQSIKGLRNSLIGIEGYASDTQIFLSIRKIATELSEHTKEVKSVSEEPISILKELKFTPPVQSFLTGGTVLCHVQNDSKSIAFQSTNVQKVQTHVAASVPKLTIDKIKLKMKIWSAVILPNKQLYFKWSKGNNFGIYTSAGKLVRYLTVENKLSCNYMAIVDKERLAFSDGTSSVVNIFNFLTQKPEKEITFSENCYGLSCDGMNLYAVGESAIFDVDLTDDLLRILSVPVNVKSVVFLSANGDKLFYADNKQDIVYCCNRKGENIWSFTNQIMLRQSRKSFTCL